MYTHTHTQTGVHVCAWACGSEKAPSGVIPLECYPLSFEAGFLTGPKPENQAELSGQQATGILLFLFLHWDSKCAPPSLPTCLPSIQILLQAFYWLTHLSSLHTAHFWSKKIGTISDYFDNAYRNYSNYLITRCKSIFFQSWKKLTVQEDEIEVVLP